MIFKNILFNVLLIIFFLCHFALASYSQTGTIAGTVTKSDGAALYKADVEIQETRKKTQTDSSGKYSFSSLPSQKYTLIISKIFYEKKEANTNVKDGETIEVPVIILIESEPIASVERLASILYSGDIEEYAKEINILTNACKNNNSEDCRIVMEINELIPKKNLISLENKTIQLLFYAGILSKESYFFKLGTTQLTNKNYNEAINSFTKSIEFEPTATFAYSNRGVAYVKMGNFDKAISDYNEALKLSSGDSNLFKLRANIFIQKKDFGSAINDYTKAIELTPIDPELYILRANAFDAIGDKEKAKADRKKADLLKINKM